MQQHGSCGIQNANRQPRFQDGQYPCGRYSDMSECLEPAAFQQPSERVKISLILNVRRDIGCVRVRVPEDRNTNEPQNPPRHSLPGGSTAKLLHLSDKTESHRKARRKHKLRHDQICETAVVMGMHQNLRTRVEVPEEVDHKHREDRKASVLIQ